MKIIHFILPAAAAAAVFLFAAGDEDSQIASFLRESLADLESLASSDPSGAGVEAALVGRKVYDRIWLYVSSANRGSGLGSNPERDRRVAIVENSLNEHQGALLLALRGKLQSQGSGGRVFDVLEYSRATEDVRTALDAIIDSPNTKLKGVGAAYDLMFRLQLDRDADRAAVLARVQKHLERSTQAALAKILIDRGANIWGLEEMKGMYRQWLSLRYSPENVPEGYGMQTLANLYSRAADGLMAFGTEGADLLDLLNLRLGELRDAGDAHSLGIASRVQQAIDVVEGNAIPMQCGNAKGNYLGISRRVMPAWDAAHSSATSGSNAKTPQSSQAAPAAQMPSENSQADGTRGSSTARTWTIWLLAALLAVVVTVVSWFAFKGRR